jgi:hypothetical protein
LFGDGVKEVEFTRIQGDPYYIVRGGPKPTLVAANPLRVRREGFSADGLMQALRETYPDAPIVESAMLSDYDGYYYDQDRTAPLPVMRVKFGDPDRTWLYIDPGMNRVLGSYTRLSRLERWIYHGLHSLDFSFWYYNLTLWRTGMIVLSLGGLATSAIGFFLGLKRLTRGMRRLA